MKKIIPFGILSILSLNVFAGDNEVNCRIETTGQQVLYAGWASCNVNGHRLEQYFQPSTAKVRQIVKWVGNGYLRCNASVPYFETVDITEKVCDYTPDAKLVAEVFNPLGEQATARLKSNSTDRDGSIVSHAWYVDGAYKGNSRIVTFPIYTSGYRTIKLTVTDNDGLKSTSSKNVNLSAGSTCGNFC
jgi:hypothetical protein